jgi:hypothetical protein
MVKVRINKKKQAVGLASDELTSGSQIIYMIDTDNNSFQNP